VIEVQHLTKRYGRDRRRRRQLASSAARSSVPDPTAPQDDDDVIPTATPATEGKAIVAGFDVFTSRSKPSADRLPRKRRRLSDMSVVVFQFVAIVVSRAANAASACRSGGTDAHDDCPTGSCGKLSRATSSASACPGPHPQPGRAHPRRTDRGLDPKQIIETELIKELPRPHHHPQHAISARGRRQHRDHQQGQGRGDRHA
jgi:hypothetical protein